MKNPEDIAKGTGTAGRQVYRVDLRKRKVHKTTVEEQTDLRWVAEDEEENDKAYDKLKDAGDEYSVKEDSNKTSFTRYNKDSEPLLKVSKTRYKTQDGKEVHGLSIVIYKPEDNPAALDDVKRILLSKENQIVSVAACGSLESAKALIDKFGGNKLDFSKDAFAGLEENTRAKVEKEVNAYLLEHPEPAAVRPSKKNRA